MTLTIPKTRVVITESDADRELARLAEAKVMGLDVEYDDVTGDLVCWSFSTGNDRVAVDAPMLGKFKPVLEDVKVKKLFHEAKGDLEKFEENGVKVGGFFADTWVMDWLQDENRRHHALKEVCSNIYDMHFPSFKETFAVDPTSKKKVLRKLKDVRREEPDKLWDYSSKDPFLTMKLYGVRRNQLEEEGLWKHYCDVERPFTLVLYDMYRAGVHLDLDNLQRIGRDVWKHKLQARHAFLREVGRDINLDSIPQLRELFNELGWESTKQSKKTGEDSYSAEVLKEWAEEFGRILAQHLLDYRQGKTLLGTFCIGLLTRQKNGIIRTELVQIGTVTGRLSSRDPNLQNIPATKDKDPFGIRRAFRAAPGNRLIVADSSGIELRLAAHLSGDEKMLGEFRPGGRNDLHSLTASAVFPHLRDKSLDDIKAHFPIERKKGKTMNFATLYGATENRVASIIGCDPEEAQPYIDSFFDLYSGLAEWIDTQKRKIWNDGYVTTLAGRKRRNPHYDDQDELDEYQRGAVERALVNTPIQGSAADVIKEAMIELHASKEFRDTGWSMRLQVHDELVSEGPKETEKEALKIKHDIMKDSFSDVLSIPLEVEVHGGDNWFEAKT